MIRLDEYRKYAKIRICYLNQFCFGKMESLVNGGLRGILFSQVDMVGKRVKFTHYIFLGTFELHKGGSTIKGSEKWLPPTCEESKVNLMKPTAPSPHNTASLPTNHAPNGADRRLDRSILSAPFGAWLVGKLAACCVAFDMVSVHHILLKKDDRLGSFSGRFQSPHIIGVSSVILESALRK